MYPHRLLGWTGLFSPGSQGGLVGGQLRRLDLSSCSRLVKLPFQLLTGCPLLETINLAHCENLTSVAGLEQSTVIRTVGLYGCKVRRKLTRSHPLAVPAFPARSRYVTQNLPVPPALQSGSNRLSRWPGQSWAIPLASTSIDASSPPCFSKTFDILTNLLHGRRCSKLETLDCRACPVIGIDSLLQVFRACPAMHPLLARQTSPSAGAPEYGYFDPRVQAELLELLQVAITLTALLPLWSHSLLYSCPR